MKITKGYSVIEREKRGKEWVPSTPRDSCWPFATVFFLKKKEAQSYANFKGRRELDTVFKVVQVSFSGPVKITA